MGVDGHRPARRAEAAQRRSIRVGEGTHHMTGRSALTSQPARGAWPMPRCHDNHKGAQTEARRACQRPRSADGCATALATDQSYRLTQDESGDVGCSATSAQRRSAGNAPCITALVEVTATNRAPKVRHCLPPAR